MVSIFLTNILFLLSRDSTFDISISNIIIYREKLLLKGSNTLLHINLIAKKRELLLLFLYFGCITNEVLKCFSLLFLYFGCITNEVLKCFSLLFCILVVSQMRY